ncbi:dihydrofolate reductase [Methylomicrobium sp. RS1]|jgi:dihydrofolate reductase|uniref:dihydrofolate reductase n=1 Tax=Candidatus Methylomicrobium oryzae TaxID=2802053 RepID=UPI001923D007|nr:dihydrofolate reductase [Methylomicrobium sp. RS1]MBL1263077.1 dihydrofolate reductase [Methylomicrobium sp. RS1]
MKISLIVAMASNRAIGLNNKMPWHLSADLKHFKKITMGSPILMGRKTFESIGRPLPGRTNIILTRNPAYAPEGCVVVHDLDTAIRTGCREHGEIFVIGGADLYEALLPRAETIYLTQIKKAFPGDTFFPELDMSEWSEVDREDVENDADAGFSYSFLRLDRIKT